MKIQGRNRRRREDEERETGNKSNTVEKENKISIHDKIMSIKRWCFKFKKVKKLKSKVVKKVAEKKQKKKKEEIQKKLK